MNDDYFQLSPSFLRTVRMIEEQQRRLDINLEPVRRHQARIDAITAPARAQIAYINQVTSDTYEPILRMANRYQRILDEVTASIPHVDDEANRLISNFSTSIYETIKNNSFPKVPSDTWSEQGFSEYIDYKIENAIGSDIISDIHQDDQESPGDVLSNSDPSDVVDNSLEHNNLRSDLTSREWHARKWIDGLYSIIIRLIYGYIFEFITSEELTTAITNLLNLFKDN